MQWHGEPKSHDSQPAWRRIFFLTRDRARVIGKLFYRGYKKTCPVEGRGDQGSRRHVVVGERREMG